MIDNKILIQKTQQQAEYWGAAGAATIVEHGEVVFDEYFGYQNKAENKKTSAETTYCFSCRSDRLVALAVMQLVDKGKISLDDTLDKYIPEYKQATKIKLLNLLQQNSGIVDYFYGVQTKNLEKDEAYSSQPFEQQFISEKHLYAKGLSFKDILALVNNLPLEFEPATKEVEYSTSSAAFLAEIVCRVSNMGLFEYMNENIFKPLGMEGVVKGNSANGLSYVCYEDVNIVALSQVDGEHAFTVTQADLVKLGKGILEGKLLSKKSWKFCKQLNKWNESCCFELFNGWYCFSIADFLGYNTNVMIQFDKDIVCVQTLSNDGTFEMRGDVWYWFKGDFNNNLDEATTFPTKVKIVPVTSKNVWSAVIMKVADSQKSFVWAPSLAIACTSVRKNHHQFVITDCGVTIGLIILKADAKEQEYHINTVLIDERFQRRGYGKLMVSWGVEWLKKKGATELSIGVNRHNVAARKLYESVGFTAAKVYDEGVKMHMKLD